MKFNRTLVAGLCLAVSFGAYAQAPAPGASASAPARNPAATPGIDKQIDNQQKRIDQGVASGQLNKREAARLQAREDKLKADTAAAKSDGVVTKEERKTLHREANANSRAIARQKHDRQHAKPHN